MTQVNCQKFFGAVVSFISMCSSLLTWYGYYRGCVLTFSDRDMGVYRNMTVAPSLDEAEFILQIEWEAGYGYHLVVVATILKIVDVVCNLAVPTPPICHDHQEQAMYERIAINRDIMEGDTSRYSPQDVESLRQSLMLAQRDFQLSSRKLGELEAIAQDWSNHSASNEDFQRAPQHTSLTPVAEGMEDEEEEEEKSGVGGKQSASPDLPPPALPPPSMTSSSPCPNRAAPTPRTRLHKSVYF